MRSLMRKKDRGGVDVRKPEISTGHLQQASPAVNQHNAVDQTGTHRQVETLGTG